jgi:hypothetical protein
LPITILPRTSLGKWSAGLTVTSIVIFAGWRIAHDWEPRPPSVLINWSYLFYAAVLTCMAALVTGLIGIIKSEERSVLVFLAALLGLLVLLYGLVIILFAHGA